MGAICAPPPLPGQAYLRTARQQVCINGLTCQPVGGGSASAVGAVAPAAGSPSQQQYNYGCCTLPGAAGAVAAAADQGPPAVLVAQRATVSGKPCRFPLLYRCVATSSPKNAAPKLNVQV